MNESQIDTTKAPSWFAESCEGKRILWGTYGDYPKQKRKWFGRSKLSGPAWLVLFTTKEEAEAKAASPYDTGWVWDGKPAGHRRLADVMFEARQRGKIGVIVQSYQNGHWIDIATYPADVPLNDEDSL